MKSKEMNANWRVMRSRAKKKCFACISYEQYVTLWDQSGKWADRGFCPGKYIVARINLNSDFSSANLQIELYDDFFLRKCLWQGLAYEINGEVFQTVTQVEEALKLSRPQIYRRLSSKLPKWNTWRVL